MSAAQRQFGRIFIPDARDADHLMSEALGRVTPKRAPAADVSWKLGPILDQGELPQCVGYGTEGWLNADPIETMDGPTPADIYAAAQKVDGMKGPHDGTTVRAAMQVMQAEGRIQEYVWANDAETVAAWLQQHGSVVVGIPWFTGMDEPSSAGRARPTGTYRGGHCVLLYRVETGPKRLWFRNSWGLTYGIQGAAWLSYADLDLILQRMQGEACGAVEQAPGSHPTPEQPENPARPR